MTNRRKLSTFARDSNLLDMARSPLEVLVIGGGITGAGIALDAAARGLFVGLIEKQDFAAGTSSRSTKLVHGGLRYLKQGEFKLVREVGRERDIVYRNALHVVIPEKMLLPLVKQGTYGNWATSLGLWVYDRLSGVKPEERRSMLTPQQTAELEPLLRQDILVGGGLYIEYRTDDARLTIELMKTAARYGAICVNYTEVTDFLYENGSIAGVRVTDRLTGESHAIKAKQIVNATGPWADQLRNMDRSLQGKRLHLTKGVHLVVKRQRFPLRQAVYFDVPDGRMIFAIPRDDTTYIGTTDTDYAGMLERPTVSQEDAAYLLQAVNSMFPEVKLSESDVVSSWAGLRPLWHEDGKSPSELSRKDEILISPSGLITIAGGKLTGYRKMAERAVDLVLHRLAQTGRRSFVPCRTEGIVLSGGDFASPGQIPELIRELTELALRIGLMESQAASLVRKYGTQAQKIVQMAVECLSWSGSGEIRFAKTQGPTEATEAMRCLLRAEIQYTIEEEMATNLNDFFIRRTGRLFFERESLPLYLSDALEEFANRLGWTEQERILHQSQFAEEYESAINFD